MLHLNKNKILAVINKTKTPLEELSELAKQTAQSIVDSFAFMNPEICGSIVKYSDVVL